MSTSVQRPVPRPPALSGLHFRNYAAATAMLVICCAAANAQSTGLTQINNVATQFVAWLRGLGLVVGLGAIVWGGMNMAFTQDFGRGFPKVLAGICGLVIAGYAQEIVNMFYTTTS